jgi:lincosamide nucleotidyltransferase B/F
MDAGQYGAFTTALTANLSRNDRVIGLVALGSMAQQDYQPDKWSDHDFFVITEPGAQEAFRVALDWLPQSENIVFHFRETQHGVKVVYNNGHLLEFAVFDPAELNLAKVNRYRVLYDRSNTLAAQLETLKMSSPPTDAPRNAADDYNRFGQFLTNLLVGVGRYRRGEKLSGHQFVKLFAAEQLLVLLQAYVPADRHALLDNLNPWRRFERVYPDLGDALNHALSLEVPEAALALVELAERELASRLPNYPAQAIAVLKELLTAVD